MIESITAIFNASDRLRPYLDASTKELDQIATISVGIVRCEPELALFNSKWFDYRLMHPTLATALFTETYIKTHGDVMLCRGRDDYKSAPFKTGIRRKALHDQPPATLTGLWKARQTADRFKIPYDFFIRSILLDTEQRGRAYLARPNQLYQPELIDNFKVDLSRRLNTGLLFSSDPFFSSDQFCHHPVQLEHIKFIIAQVKLRGEAREDLTLASAIYINHVLTPTQAMQFCSEESLKRAARVAGNLGFI